MEEPTHTGDTVVVLYTGGRLASWDRLSAKERQGYEQQHVDLMLDVAGRNRLMQLNGYRLIAPQGDRVRFWTIEFPDLAGAEAWIEAEMAPPYGDYGHYEYQLARRIPGPAFPDLTVPPRPPVSPTRADPHVIPRLEVDSETVTVLLFEQPESGGGGAALQQDTAEAHGLLWLEGFRLIGRNGAWRQVWIAAFSSLHSAEAWIEAESGPPQNQYSRRMFHLARPWAPAYFAAWAAYASGSK